MKVSKDKPKKSFTFIRPPIAVVQIQRHGKWFDTLWVEPGCNIKSFTTNLSDKLGKVTGVRVKYLNEEGK